MNYSCPNNIDNVIGPSNDQHQISRHHLTALFMGLLNLGNCFPSLSYLVLMPHSLFMLHRFNARIKRLFAQCGLFAEEPQRGRDILSFHLVLCGL